MLGLVLECRQDQRIQLRQVLEARRTRSSLERQARVLIYKMRQEGFLRIDCSVDEDVAKVVLELLQAAMPQGAAEGSFMGWL